MMMMKSYNKPQLFLLHFAGGNCYSFQFLIPYLNDFDVITLELPGRGMRMKEQLVNDFNKAVLDIFHQLSGKLNDSPFIVYGHSMGAYLAIKVTGILERINRYPQIVIVSGNPGPGVRENKKRYLLNKPEFVKELRDLGGVPEELIQNEEVYNFFEPILRADFEIAEEHGLSIENTPPINAPLYTLMGDQEEDVEKIMNWSNFTTKQFRHHIFKGGHFFIREYPLEISNIIKKSYCNSIISILSAISSESISK